MNCLATRTVRRGPHRSPAKPRTRVKKINTTTLVVDLSQLLTEPLTKAQVNSLLPLLRQAWINVLTAKDGRRWRVKLTSERAQLQA